jgi:hypothetical protein
MKVTSKQSMERETTANPAAGQHSGEVQDSPYKASKHTASSFFTKGTQQKPRAEAFKEAYNHAS